MTPRSGFAFPTVLIGIGLAALLANAGLLPSFSWFGLVRLWPLLLVLIGIELLFARRAPVVALGLDALVVAVGVWLLVTTPAPRFGGFPFGDLIDIDFDDCPVGAAQQSVSLPRDGASRLDLQLTAGAGTFRVAGAAGGGLVDASADRPALVVRSTSRGGDEATVRMTICHADLGARDVDVRVANDVRTSLALTGGAGTFELDLRDVRLAEARLTNGASRLTLQLPRPSGDVPIRITGGASTIDIRLPTGAEARVQATGGLTTLDSPRTTSTSIGRSSYETAGYGNASDRFTITVTGGVSTVTVR